MINGRSKIGNRGTAAAAKRNGACFPVLLSFVFAAVMAASAGTAFGQSGSSIGALGTIEPDGGIVTLTGNSGAEIREIFLSPDDTVAVGDVIVSYANADAVSDKILNIELELQELTANHERTIALHGLSNRKARADLVTAQENLDAYRNIPQNAQVNSIRIERENAVNDARHAVNVAVAEQAQSTTRYEQAKQRIEQRLVQARREVDQTVMTSAFAGTVLDVLAHPGADGRSAIARIANLSDIRVVCDVFEGDLSRVRIGQRAVVANSAFGQDLGGEVVRIGREVDGNKKIGKVWVALDEDDLGARYLGMEVNVTIRTE